MSAKKKIRWDCKGNKAVSPDRKLTQTQLDRLELWRVFNDRQGGSFPPNLAADYLRMTTEGVRKAASRGHILYVRIGRNRFYGKKDLENYRYTLSRKFPEDRKKWKRSSGELKISDLRKP